MIEAIEISPTDRARCSYCKQIIGKGTPRGVESVQKRNYSSQQYYCYKCTLDFIDNKIETQKNIKKDFKKLIKKQTKEIITSEL